MTDAEIAGIRLAHEAQACDNDGCAVFTFNPTGRRSPGSSLNGCPACGHEGFPVFAGLTTRGGAR
jgi:hypothetical protein